MVPPNLFCYCYYYYYIVVVVVVGVVVDMANEWGGDLVTPQTMECGRANEETTTSTCSDYN
jgi:hypothetical protein